MKLYRVEIFEENNWIILSRHRNDVNAEINAIVINKSRKCPVRIIYDGKVIYEKEGGNNGISRI